MNVLTGGIGSGKSVVARLLRLRGFGVYDCDFRARRLMESSSELKHKIQAIAGEEVYDQNGKLQRKLLGSLIFSDPEIRQKINALVHEAVRNDIAEWTKLKEENIFVETAIAAQSGLADLADQVWVVDASLQDRIERVSCRDNRCEDEILKIIKAQEKEEEALIDKGIEILRIRNNPTDFLMDQIDEALLSKKVNNKNKIK